MNSVFMDINFSLSILWLFITVVVYIFALYLYKVSASIKWLNPFLHPLITSTTVVIACMHVSHTELAEYQSYTQLLSMLLGPATVALAIPLYTQLQLLLKMNWRVLLPIAVAAVLAPTLAWTSLYLLNTPLNLQMTMLVKSITTPLAMDAAGAIGGIPALAAVFVISTGIVGAVMGPSLFALLGVTNHAAQGTALGAVSHAIGTAKAISISQQCAAFATLALCLNGIATALILPVLFAT